MTYDRRERKNQNRVPSFENGSDAKLFIYKKPSNKVLFVEEKKEEKISIHFFCPFYLWTVQKILNGLYFLGGIFFFFFTYVWSKLK